MGVKVTKSSAGILMIMALISSDKADSGDLGDYLANPFEQGFWSWPGDDCSHPVCNAHMDESITQAHYKLIRRISPQLSDSKTIRESLARLPRGLLWRNRK